MWRRILWRCYVFPVAPGLCLSSLCTAPRRRMQSLLMVPSCAVPVWVTSAVLLRAAQLAAGVRGSAGVAAFVRVRLVGPDVRRADMGVLPAMDMAHTRHRARTLP